jgi:glycosyltransferase involved in cell wall biosynthesis
MLVQRKRSDDGTVSRFRPDAGLGRRLARRWRRWRIERDHARYEASAPGWREPFHGDRTEFAGEVVASLPPADVVNLHWISRLVDYRAFFDGLPERLPVVWTLHDMNLFTGGCHYDRGCGAYRRRCGRCPQLGSEDEDDLSRQVWRRKRDLFSRTPRERLHLVTPSRWLAEEASASSLIDDRFPVSVIPYGLDTNAFAPRDRGFARQVLDLPREAKVVLFVAHSVENDRKGFGMLREALAGLTGEEGLVLLSLGKGEPAVPEGIEQRHLGFVSDDRYLSVIYSAADVFVIPSRQDNLPATVLEAMACGTPVVGSDVGGIPEMVRPGETGYLAEDGDPDDLRDGILRVLRDPDGREALSRRCRERVLGEYGLERQARRYERLYRELLSGEADAKGVEARSRGDAPGARGGGSAPGASALASGRGPGAGR